MTKRIIVLIFFLMLFTNLLLAQTSIPASTIVSENFNSIGTSGVATLPSNWKMSSAGTGATSGWATGTNIIATTQAASSGTPATGGAYNWATTSGSDRAIGFMTDGAYASPNSVMAFYQNTTGTTVTTITIVFGIERYRVNTSSFSLAFFSSTDGTAWTARTAGDISAGVFATGVSVYNFGFPQTIYKTVTITGLSIANNGDFYLRWLFTNTGSTNSQGLALDDVSLFAGTITPAISATLRDALTIDNPPINQANPGDQLTYTTTIKNTGTGDANAVNLTVPAPTNTTLVGGSVKTSALARDDNYSTPFNTTLTGSNVITNDYGLPSVTVVSFGPVKDAAATAAGGIGTSDNGGTVVVNTNGTFTYNPPSGFVGVDKFAYIATTGNAPDNDAVVTVSIGSAASSVNDSYNVIGNVSISPNAAAGVLNNDAGTGIFISAVNGSAANVGVAILTANNGNLTVNADGSFTYNPAKGFDGPTDNFTYTIDNGFATPSTATVTLNISGMVWFINAAAAGGGDGRLSAPFNSIVNFQTVNVGGAGNPDINDYIFVYENASAYTGSLTLLNGQKLIGQDATASLSSITGLVPNATYSAQFPAMNTGAPATTLSTTVAATNAVNLGSGNTLRGFTLGNTTGSGISGTSFGTLVVSEVSKNGTGQALALTTGAFGSPATLDNITTTSSVNAVSLTGCTGTLTLTTGAISGATGTAFNISGGTCSVTYSGGITQANNAAMVSISGGHVTGTITFQTGTLSATNGTGLQFDNADGTYNFNGTTTLNGGDAGIDILNGSGGAFTFGTGTSITSPSGTAFNIGGTANTCGVTYSGAITKNNAGSMVSIANHATGTVTFQTGTLSATTASTGNGLQFDNADGTYNFNGTTTLNGGDAGIDILNGSAGTFTFGTGTAITSPSGIAFNIGGTASTCAVTYSGSITQTNNAAMVSISGGHATGTVTFQTGTLSATNGTGLQFDNADGIYNFTGACTLNGGDAGIDIINGSGGNFSFNNAPITNPSGVAFLVSGGGGSIGHTGIISKTSAGRLIDIQSRTGGSVTINSNLSSTVSSTGINVSSCTGGTITFVGGTKTMNTPGSNPVNLATNTGATINFTNGGLAITSTTATGFNATGGGTISVQGTGNTITSTTGTALNVTNTTIGAGNLTFQSISANGGANGIVLNNTGTAAGDGGLIVTGNSSGNCGGSVTVNPVGTAATVGAPVIGDCTGGTIQNTTGAGISLTSTKNVSLTRVYVLNCGTDEINALSVNGFTLDHSFITDNSGVSGDRGIEMGDFSTGTPVNGSINITNSTVGPTPHDNFGVGIASGTSTWNITSSVFTGSVLNSGFNFEIRNATVSSFMMDGCVLKNQFADGMQMQPASGVSATLTSATIQNSSFLSNNIGMDLNHDGTGTTTYKVLTNTFLNQVAQPINFFSSAVQAPATGGILNGRFVNNRIGDPAQFKSGSGIGNGIRININGGVAARVLVDANVIRQVPNGRGIEIISRNGTGGTDATVTNNTVNTDFVTTVENGGFSLSNIFLQSNCVTVCNSLRSDIRNNVVPATPPNGELVAGQLVLIRTGASTNQLVDNAPASPDAASELASHNTGSTAVSGTVTLIAGPINTPPLLVKGPETKNNTGISGPAPSILTDSKLLTIADAAIARWAKAGLSEEQLLQLKKLKFEISDLTGAYISDVAGDIIRVDKDAGTFQWFIDDTPMDDAEFSNSVNDSQLNLNKRDAAANSIDLLTAIMHEIGHYLGIPDTYIKEHCMNLMYGYLTVGERRLPTIEMTKEINKY